MSRKIETFRPINEKMVNLYTCGPTVYSDPHIGNWRAFVMYDLLKRVLLANGYNVNHVLNITDVGHLTSDEDEGEDKLAKTARKQRKTAWQIADQYIGVFKSGIKDLNIISPNHMPRATDWIDAQIEYIKLLTDKGLTYQIDDGVYFDVSKYKDYGKLARLNLSGQQAGSRVARNLQKRSAYDFVLWKLSPTDSKRDMEWPSPWGIGFPGWHLECSVMAQSLLGETIDIHAGGIDHISIHHTNEIAQSESVTGKPLANYWMHIEFLMINDIKFSKSLGNSITLETVKERGYRPSDLRLFYLQSHYKTKSHFSWSNLDAAHNRLLTLINLAELRFQYFKNNTHPVFNFENPKLQILSALSNDLSTPQVLEILSAIADQLNTTGIGHTQSQEFEAFMNFIDNVLGLGLLDITSDVDEKVKKLLIKRNKAKQDKDYDLSDHLRDNLIKHGIAINDTVQGVIWRSL